MAPVDIVILLLVGVAFAAVVLRMRKKGVCGGCANAGSCAHAGSCAGAGMHTGACAGCDSSKRMKCPACEGVERTAEKLSRNIDKS
jgi:hypothetical protein